MTQNLRIRGIVKTATTAKNILKVGIKSSEIASFQQYLQDAITQIETICQEANTYPHDLPIRSRNAYYFLKQIDLDNLPIIASESEPISPVKSQPTIGVKNIVSRQKTILRDIYHLAKNQNQHKFQQLKSHLDQNINIIENICRENQLTPSNLSNSARPIYAWMKFLHHSSWLEKQILATRQAQQFVAQIQSQKTIKKPNIFVGFTNIRSLYRAKKEPHQDTLTFNQGFITAEPRIIREIITSIFLGKNRHSSQLIRQYTESEEFRNILLQLDLSAEIGADHPQGKFYNLNLLFRQINRQYFNNSLTQPRLTWSQSLSKRKFGHYEPNRDRVVLSLTLDDPQIPAFVPEFVLYHELLHKHCGQKWENGLSRVHTPEFKQLERQFNYYHEAEAWLDKLSRLV
jgi:hypothetical protein